MSSRSADRLQVLVNGGKSVIATNPDIAKRIASLEIGWEERSGELLPTVKITFRDPEPLRGGVIG
ncbi:hypothetical protein RVBP21_1760 [Pseudomonas phage BRkr]|nr:hypothetical protein RVBP21_1760 [Pseudomonas phage BRkr]